MLGIVQKHGGQEEVFNAEAAKGYPVLRSRIGARVVRFRAEVMESRAGAQANRVRLPPLNRVQFEVTKGRQDDLEHLWGEAERRGYEMEAPNAATKHMEKADQVRDLQPCPAVAFVTIALMAEMIASVIRRNGLRPVVMPSP